MDPGFIGAQQEEINSWKFINKLVNIQAVKYSLFCDIEQEWGF